MAHFCFQGAGLRGLKFSLTGILSALILTLISVISVASAEAAEVGPVQTFCVQTMNMYGPAYASDREIRFTLASQYFAKEACDVVNLQEVWNEGQFQTLVEEPLISWPMLQSRYFGRTKQDPKGPRFGMATLTGHEILESKKHVFAVNYEMDSALGSPLEAAREALNIKKGYGVAVIKINGLYPIAFINTHLHPTSEIVRLAQSIELLNEVDHYLAKDIPVIVTGDLNTQPGSLELNTLKYAGKAQDTLNWTDECTYCFWNKYSIKIAFMNDRMDYILLFNSKSYELETQNSGIGPESHRGFTLSDHYGVHAQIRIQKKTNGSNESQQQNILGQIAMSNAIHELEKMEHKPEYWSVLNSARRMQSELADEWKRHENLANWWPNSDQTKQKP